MHCPPKAAPGRDLYYTAKADIEMMHRGKANLDVPESTAGRISVMHDSESYSIHEGVKFCEEPRNVLQFFRCEMVLSASRSPSQQVTRPSHSPPPASSSVSFDTSTFPPHSTTPTRGVSVQPKLISFTDGDIRAAMPTAALGSMTSFIRSKMTRIQRLISFSDTVTISSTESLTIGHVLLPRKDLSPSAIVSGSPAQLCPHICIRYQPSSPVTGWKSGNIIRFHALVYQVT